MKFTYVVNPDKRYVIAMAKSDGKTIKGVAKCSSNDVFDEELGKAIASARCRVKVMRRQALEASDYVDTYRAEKETAERKLRNAEQFAWDQFVKVDDAEKELAKILANT